MLLQGAADGGGRSEESSGAKNERLMKKQDYEKWQEELVGDSCYCTLLLYCALCDITGSGSAWEDALVFQ